MKASQLYGNKIEQSGGKINGYILAISCAEDKIEGYICCDERENEFFAESAGLIYRGDKFLFKIKGKENKNCYRLRLGQAAFSDGGKFLGFIDDFIFKGDRIAFALIGRKKYAYSRLTLGDAVIVKTADKEAETAAKDMFISAILSGD